MKEQNNYICKIATLEEVKTKWNQDIQNSDNPMYKIAKIEDVEEIKRGSRIPYIGILDNQIICEITAIITPEGIGKEAQSSKDLVTDKRCFLCAIKTKKEYENKGYFKRLYFYLEQDLLKKGFEEISLAVDQNNNRNIEIYKHLGFTNYIKKETNQNYMFDYYFKTIKK